MPSQNPTTHPVSTGTLGCGVIVLGIVWEPCFLWPKTNPFPGCKSSTVLSLLLALNAGITFLSLWAGGSLDPLEQQPTES